MKTHLATASAEGDKFPIDDFTDHHHEDKGGGGS
jgi:hypothetical protein